MANNVAASMKASIIIDKKEIISSALSAYAEAQKEIAGNKIELLVDVSDDKARERLKEISKELAGKDYVIKFKNQGIEETMKSLDELFGRIKDVINLSNGISNSTSKANNKQFVQGEIDAVSKLKEIVNKTTITFEDFKTIIANLPSDKIGQLNKMLGRTFELTSDVGTSLGVMTSELGKYFTITGTRSSTSFFLSNEGEFTRKPNKNKTNFVDDEIYTKGMKYDPSDLADFTMALQKQEQQAIDTAKAQEKLAETEKNLGKSATIDNSKIKETINYYNEIYEIQRKLDDAFIQNRQLVPVSAHGFDSIEEGEKALNLCNEMIAKMKEYYSLAQKDGYGSGALEEMSRDILDVTQNIKPAVERALKHIKSSTEQHILDNEIGLKIDNSKSNAPKELLDEYISVISKINNGFLDGQEGINILNTKAKELGVTFDETSRKWVNVAATSSSSDINESSAQIDRLKNKLDELSQKYEELSKSTIVSGKDVDLVDNEEFQKLSKEFATLKQELSDIKIHMELFEQSAMSYDAFIPYENQIGELSSRIEKLINDYRELAIVQKDLEGNKSNISSPIKDTFQGDTEASEMGKVATAVDEAVQAKKDFATANEGVQASVDGSKSKLELETELMERLAKSAREAADAKKEFVEANKQVQDSVDKSENKLKAESSLLSGHTDNSQPANVEKYQQSTTRAPKNSKLLSADNKLELGTELKRLQTEIIASLDETTTFIKEVTDFYDSQNNLVKTQMKVLDKNNSMRTYTTSYSVDKEGNANTWTSHITTEKIAEKTKQTSKEIQKEWEKNVEVIQKYMDANTELNNLKAKDKGTGKHASDIARQEKEVGELRESALKARAVLSSMVNPHEAPIDDWNKWLEVMKQFEQATKGSAKSVARLEDALRNMAESQAKKVSTTLSNSQDYLKTLKPTEGNRSSKFSEAVLVYSKAVTELDEFNKKLDTSTTLTKEQVTEFERISSEIKNAKKNIEAIPKALRGSDEDSREKEIDKLTKYLAANTKILPTARKELERYLELLKSGNPEVSVKELHTAWTKVAVAEREAHREGKKFWDILTDKAVYGAAAQLAGYYLSLTDFIRYAGNAITVIRELDTALVDLKKTTAMTSSQLEDFYFDSNDVAKEMGVTTQAIIDQASAWSRLGFSTKEASTEMAKLSAQFAAISPGMDLDVSTDGLVSTMKAFDIEVEDVERRIMDNINKIGNTAATDNTEIVDMLTRSSAAMAVANNTLEETIALETAAVEITRSAETTGTAFKTLSMRIRGRQTLPPYTVMYMLCA